MEFETLSPYVGARIHGLDLREPFSPARIEELRAAFRKYRLLTIHQPDLPAEDQLRFAELFGKVEIRGKSTVAKDAPLTQYVSNAREDGILGTGEIEFHHDHLFYASPLKAIILYGVEIPASGSATRFRDAATVFERLPGELRAKAEGVKVLHLYNYSGDYTAWQDPAKAPPDSPRAWQPLIWLNPDSGRRTLWLCPSSAVDFEGIAMAEGRALIEAMTAFADSTDELTYTHRWRPGDLLMWDNRMLQHARADFDAKARRTLRRTPIA
ncbi:MAG: TauD/TfdA dioxygenase family protein [Alphaproteobacteria bacterium]